MAEEQKTKRALPVVEIVEEPKVEKMVVTPVVTKKGCGWLYRLMLFVVFGLGVAGGFWWGSGIKGNNVAMFQTPTPVPMLEPMPLPTPEPVVLTQADFEVVVLNGSGETGLAGTTATQLELLGYRVGPTGNAAVQTGTTIAFGERAATLSAEILKDMEPVLQQVVVTDEVLDDEFAIRVILGGRD